MSGIERFMLDFYTIMALLALAASISEGICCLKRGIDAAAAV